jgi:hypothetical protein
MILGGMKTLVFAAMALLLGFPSYAQYSARSLTRKIVPPAQQPAQPARPAPQAVPTQPAAPARPPTPQEEAKAQIQKDKNDVKQFEFYKRRAEEGSDDAQYQLGVRYLAGKGTDKNEKLGREWLAKAAKQGHAQASKKLAELGPEPASAPAAHASATPATPTK